MNYASLFTGIGGPDIFAELFDWKIIFQCEIVPQIFEQIALTIIDYEKCTHS